MNKFFLFLSFAVLYSCGREKYYDCPKNYCGMRVVDFGDVDTDYTLEISCGEYIEVDFPYADEKYFIGDTICRQTALEKQWAEIYEIQKRINNIGNEQTNFY